MGKVVGTILLIAAVVAIAIFVPQLVALIPGLTTAATGALTAVGLAISTAATMILTLAVSMVAQMLLKPKTPKLNQAMMDRLNTSVVPTAPRKIIFGNTAAGADVRFEEKVGGGTDTTNPAYYYQVIALASHKLTAVQSVYIEDELSYSSGAVTGKYSAGFTCVPTLEGTSSNGAAFGSGSWWTSTSTFTGCAYLKVSYKLDQQIWPNGLPSRFTTIVQGCPVYDPRLDSTAGGSGTMRAATQSTWLYTSGANDIGRNPALCLLTYLIGYKINGVLAWGMGIPTTRINLANFISYANVCDESVTTLGGGTTKRYFCDAIFDTAMTHEAIITSITNTMGTTVLVDTCGSYQLVGGHDDTTGPILSFSQDDMTGPYTWKPTVSTRDRYNIATGQFASPADLYTLKSWGTLTINALNDSIPRTQQMDFAGVSRPEQCQRIAKQRLVHNQYQGTLTCNFGPAAFKAQVGSLIYLSLPPENWNNKLFRVIDQQESAELVFSMMLQEESTQVYAWDLNETIALPANVNIGKYDALEQETVQGLTATARQTTNSSGATDSWIDVHWTVPSTIVKSIQIQAKPHPDTIWQSLTSNAPASAGAYTFRAPVAGVSTDVQARFVMISGVYGPWVAANLTSASGAPNGLNNATVYLYQRALSAPAVPSVTTTYTFATGILTGQNNGWSQTLPAANGSPLYVTIATASNAASTDTIANTEWASPVVMTSEGVQTAEVFIYQRAASAPAKPSVTTTYTFSTGVLTGLNNGWVTAVPAANGNPLWVSTASALATVTATTDSIASTEWATPQIMAQDGATGPAGLNNATVNLYQRAASTPAVPASTTTYTFATGVLSGTLGSWTQTAPTTNGQPLYMTAATASSAAATDTIGTAEWATPIVLAQDGATGATGSSAATLRISADQMLITYDGTGALSPSSQTVNFNAMSTNLSSATFTISMTKADGTVINANTYLSTAGSTVFTASGNNITMTVGHLFALTGTNFSTARGATNGVKITVSHADGVSDTVTIVKAADGANGPNGLTAKTLMVRGNRSVIAYDNTNAPNPTAQSTNFFINSQNLSTATFTISLTDTNGTAMNANSYFTTSTGTFTASGNNIIYATAISQMFSLTAANFDTARNGTSGIIVTVTHADGLTDSCNLVKSSDGSTGAAAPNYASIFIYRRNATTPALPSASTTYTFATNTLTGLTNSWTQGVPTTNGNPLWVSSATALSTSTTDTIANTEWAAPAILASDGAAGATGATGSTGAQGPAGPAGNMIPSPITLSSAVTSGTGSIENTGVTTSRMADYIRGKMTSSTAVIKWCSAGDIGVTPDDTLYYRMVIYGSTTGTQTCVPAIEWYAANGTTLVSTTTPSAMTVTATVSSGHWQLVEASVTVPAGVAYAVPKVTRTGTTTVVFYPAEPYFGRVEPGATYGADFATTLANIPAGVSAAAVTLDANGNVVSPLYLPPTTAAGGGYAFTGAITYTATATTATISVAAGSLYVGTSPISYSAMSASVTGTSGTTVTYFLYVDTNVYTAGAHTLKTSTAQSTLVSTPGVVMVGSVAVTFTSGGTGGGIGGGGGGFGGGCVAEDAWVETRDRGFVLGNEIVAGDMLRCLDLETMEGTLWKPVLSNKVSAQPTYRITSESGITLRISDTAPLTLRDGSSLMVPELDGHELPVQDENGFGWERCWLEPIGTFNVCYISLGGQVYAAGDVQGRSILTHNTTYKQ